MTTCSTDGCNRKAIRDGFCSTHIPKKVTVLPTYTYLLLPIGGTGAPNAGFQALLGDERTQYVVSHFCSEGPDGAASRKKAYEVKKGVPLNHDTLGAGDTHRSIFWRWQGNVMHVYAMGQHENGNNKKYNLTWHDGTSLNWTRPG